MKHARLAPPWLALLGLLGCQSPPPADATAPTYDAFAPLALPAPNEARSASGAPGPGYWQQRADYVIDAVLDPEALTLSARATVTYHNNSPHHLDYLWLSLEQNAFRDDGLAEWMAPSAQPLYAEGVEAGYALQIRLPAGTPLPHRTYESLARVDLPAPLAPGASFVFAMEWAFPIMTGEALRQGVEQVEQGLVLQLAQWFPALCVYDDVHGWNTLPFLRTGEFYTDFGDYDVRIQLPRAYTVVATGALQNADEVLSPLVQRRLERARLGAQTVPIVRAEEVGDPALRPEGEGPLVWHFVAEDVRTFAFAASDAWIWDASSTNTGVLCQSLYPREGLPHWEQSTDMLRWSVEFYSDLWLPYPYPHATNVNGAEWGMEYPMILFSGSRISEYDVFAVTTHEMAHNWFPMIVNTDERRHAWMDEGLNTLGNVLAVAERYPELDFYSEVEDFTHVPDDFARWMQAAVGHAAETPHDQIPEAFQSFLAYDKPAMALLLLRNEVLGPERFDRAFRDYVRRWAFKCPRPADFYRSLSDAAGADLDWFWTSWFEDAPALDFAARELTWEEGVAALQVENVGGALMELELHLELEDGARLSRRLPVELWSRGARVELELPCSARPLALQLDPERRLPDVDRANDRLEL